MKLPNDIKQAITQELLDELHEDLIHFCLNCNADITAKEMFCSSECIQADLDRRYGKHKLVSISKPLSWISKYNCIQCSSPSDQYLCSAECLKEDLEKRKNKVCKY